jgi:hypothetical protein
MKKIRLELDALAVDSFSTEEASTAEGTVHARSSDGYMGACTPSESNGPGCFCLPDFNPGSQGC